MSRLLRVVAGMSDSEQGSSHVTVSLNYEINCVVDIRAAWYKQQQDT